MGLRPSVNIPAHGPVSDRIETALALRGQGRLEEALALLQEPREFSQDYYLLRGDLQFELGQIQDAVGSYSTVVAFENDNVYAHQHLALCLWRLERWAAAAEAYRKILSCDSHRDNARIGLGECLLRLNCAEEALSCFDECWTEAARGPALFGKAVALQLLQRFDEAESAYERLLALDAKAEEALSNLIALSMERADFERLQRYSLQLLELSPQSGAALMGLTLAALDRGEDESAARYYTRLTSLPPHDELTHDAGQGPAIEHRLSPEAAARLNQARSHLQEGGGE